MALRTDLDHHTHCVPDHTTWQAMADPKKIADIVTELAATDDAKTRCSVFDNALLEFQTKADNAALSLNKLWNVARVLAIHRDYR